jgi:hypothetical protein
MIAIFLLGSFVYLGSKAQENGDNHTASQGGTASASMASSRSYSVQHGSQHPGSVLPKIFLLLCGQRGTLGKLRPGLLETGVWCVRFLAPSTPYKWSGILLFQVLLCPIMLASIKEKTFYIFGIANAITLQMVGALHPESS